MKYQELLERFAHQMAVSQGLEYYGFGRYGKDGHVTHVSKFDTLRPVHKVEPLKTLPGDILKHLQHSDDEVFNNGVDGVRNVLDHIHALKYNSDRVVVSQKIDGAPSVVFGTHPDTGKFFVASKSAFNKDPKINYTDEDVDRNHGHAPGLAQKLKELLAHGHKLRINGVVQGDMLFGEHDKEHHGGKVAFKPNTIRYAIDANKAEGYRVSRAKIGIALHTEYKNGRAILNPNIRVEDHPDIYNMSVSVPPEKLSFDKDKLSYHQHHIGKLMNQVSREGWDAVTHPSSKEHVMTYVNSKVRAGDSLYKVDELISHIHSKLQKGIDSVKTEKSKTTKEAQRDELIGHIKANKSHFKHAFAIQKHIADAKHHIIDRLNHGQTFEHSYEDGTPAHPEGYVMVGHHGPLKFVNREDFSRVNFNAGAFKK